MKDNLLNNNKTSKQLTRQIGVSSIWRRMLVSAELALLWIEKYLFRDKDNYISNPEIIKNLIRPHINVEDWALRAEQHGKEAFLHSTQEPNGGVISKYLAHTLKNEAHQVRWIHVIKAYNALVQEFADWHFN